MVVESFTKVASKCHLFPYDVSFPGPTAANNCCSSTESTPRTRPIAETTDKGKHSHSLRG